MSFLRGPGFSQRQELTIRRLSTANLMSNGGFIVAIVFVGLILVAILTLCFFRHYDTIRKACRRRRTVVNKKKRDVRDYKATEVVVKTLDKPIIGGAAVAAVAADGGADSATASVITATVHDMASIFSGGNHDADFSESSWTTMGNLPVGDGDIPILTNSHTPRSARGESKVVPVDYPVA